MRAAVIVCEQDCVKGQLDYAFREDYESISGGPSLNPAWGEGTFDTSLGPYRYCIFQIVSGFLPSEIVERLVPEISVMDVNSICRFGPGEGLELDQSRCMKGSAYSVIIEVKFA